MAKTKCSINTSRPTNQTERPVFVTRDTVIVAMKIIAPWAGASDTLIGPAPRQQIFPVKKISKLDAPLDVARVVEE